MRLLPQMISLMLALPLGATNVSAQGSLVAVAAASPLQVKSGPEVRSGKSWILTGESFSQKRDGEGSASSRCQKLRVVLAKELSLDLECDNYRVQQVVPLHKSETRTVTRQGDHLTITQFGYMVKKIQVDQFNQTSLRIPYVEEIIHLNVQANGDLVFHQQKFQQDQFGRIVQSNVVEARGLVAQEVSLVSQSEKAREVNGSPNRRHSRSQSK